MSYVYYCKCDHCGYCKDDLFVGWGFSFSRIREHIKRRILLGDYGHEIMNVARSISKLKVEQSNEIFVCKKCGDVQLLDLIELFDESQDSDKPVYTYKHHCEKCCGVFERIVLENGKPKKEVLCPQCKKALTVGPCGHWD